MYPQVLWKVDRLCRPYPFGCYLQCNIIFGTKVGGRSRVRGPEIAKWCKTDSAKLRSRSMCESRKKFYHKSRDEAGDGSPHQAHI